MRIIRIVIFIGKCIDKSLPLLEFINDTWKSKKEKEKNESINQLNQNTNVQTNDTTKI